MKISTVFVYDEPSVPEIQIDGLINFISDTFRIKVEPRKNIFSYFKSDIASELASCRIFKTREPFQRHTPTSEEIKFEEESFVNSKETNIIMYDGYEFLKTISNLLPEDETTSDQFHLICTNKLTCTFDSNDYRYHGRAVICSNPSIISTTGMIEAPAKPRDFYLKLLSSMTQGLNKEMIEEEFKGQYLEYHDQRIGEVIKGYVSQAIFFYLTGESFCESVECRLFNSHWQADLLHSQIESGKFCDKHQKILENLLTNS